MLPSPSLQLLLLQLFFELLLLFKGLEGIVNILDTTIGIGDVFLVGLLTGHELLVVVFALCSCHLGYRFCSLDRAAPSCKKHHTSSLPIAARFWDRLAT
jgi:hypothetical protein